jgi:hypothetical protein
MADDREDVFSKAVRAGKRTYFFDVKSTRGRDLYLTITESKKHTHEDGSATYDKHKIFLYKEDFRQVPRWTASDAIAEIDRLRAGGDYVQREEPRREEPHGTEPGPSEMVVVPTRTPTSNFEDLDKKEILISRRIAFPAAPPTPLAVSAEMTGAGEPTKRSDRRTSIWTRSSFLVSDCQPAGRSLIDAS